MHSNTFKTTALAALAALFAFTVAAHGAIAAGSHSGGHDNDKGHGHSMAIGEPGDPAKADRTIAITMSDNFFEPEEIKIKEGETIRFVVSNKGEFLHEFNIGTAAMHAAHQKEMAEMMEHGMITATGIDHKMMKMDHGGGKMMMEHNDPNSVLLEPGKQAEVIWRFTKEAELEFACNVPGHYESGMMGPIHMQHGH
jgi:uncharacterized cupredoxin-like copper-binding protein